ncbi:hypothetical protein [Haloterrigena alkaliphila]|uniref:Uncharacterized protein n=1 Tax=Haloterrigena alkaliphila TaxID=2816475 RepID=A0A8A2VFG3_9EURY|nr:hypothetical protein [Haloterrigena alkaliphila]QSW99407.1 hypothetical protein J0X25_00165 [Haloterrigena alkaliphila]
MNEEQKLTSASDRPIEHGRTYDHAHHGPVEVTGIWQKTRWVETVRDGDEQETVVIRFLPPDGDDWSDERSASLNEFLEHID